MHLSANTHTVLTFLKMYKKCLFFIYAVFILEVKSDCDGYLDCFSGFFTNFFTPSNDYVEYINTTAKDLPNDFVQVQNVQVSELNKVLAEISGFIQQDITDQLKTQSDSAFFANVNPKTKVYVKTFTYSNPENVFVSDFGNVDFVQETVTEKNIENVIVEDPTSYLLSPPTIIAQNDDNEILQLENNNAEDVQKEKDIRDNEIPISDDILSYYDSVEDNSTDYPIIDYIDMYKDTTNEENIYNPPTGAPVVEIQNRFQETSVENMENLDSSTSDNTTDVRAVFPWITTIFIKNDSKSNQFEYYCDGALLNERVLVTAARCVMQGNSTVDPDSLLVILGKRSLLSMVDKEQAVKIKQVITHENFTNEGGKIENDLALLVFENSVQFNEIIQPAVIGNDTEEVDKSYTTAWNPQGDLVPVALENTKTQNCKTEKVGEDMFCATYGLKVALCPSYGGIFAGYQDSWQLFGIRSGDATERGLCFSKEVWFTDLRAYNDWIMENIE